MMHKYELEISVILITYNSKWQKVKITLDSIVCQRNIGFEIVISDDGSIDNNYQRIIEYFHAYPEVEISFINNTTNVGTVQNCIRAIKNAGGRYVKLISPGDVFIGETLLADWLHSLKASKKSWSFGNLMFYRAIDKNMYRIESHCLSPYHSECDLGNEGIENARLNFLAHREHIPGPGVLIEKKVWMKYLTKLSELVKYTEDYSYDIMIYDNIMPFYYKKNVVMYEMGLGISTSGNSRWSQIVTDEMGVFYGYMGKKLADIGAGEKAVLAEVRPDATGWRRRSSLYADTGYLTRKMYEECCVSSISKNRANAENKKIWIYGAGLAGKIVKQSLERKCGIEVAGFIDKRHKEIKSYEGLRVVGIEDVNADDGYLFISLLEYDELVIEKLQGFGFDERNYSYIFAHRIVDAI